MSSTRDFEKLLGYLERLPAIDLPGGRESIGRGVFDDGNWWVKFSLKTEHPLGWRHVQELMSMTPTTMMKKMRSNSVHARPTIV